MWKIKTKCHVPTRQLKKEQSLLKPPPDTLQVHIPCLKPVISETSHFKAVLKASLPGSQWGKAGLQERGPCLWGKESVRGHGEEGHGIGTGFWPQSQDLRVLSSSCTFRLCGHGTYFDSASFTFFVGLSLRRDIHHRILLRILSEIIPMWTSHRHERCQLVVGGENSAGGPWPYWPREQKLDPSVMSCCGPEAGTPTSHPGSLRTCFCLFWITLCGDWEVTTGQLQTQAGSSLVFPSLPLTLFFHPLH